MRNFESGDAFGFGEGNDRRERRMEGRERRQSGEGFEFPVFPPAAAAVVPLSMDAWTVLLECHP